MDELENKDLEQQEEVVEEVKSFTQEEVDKMLQSETDRVVTKALQTAKEKWELEYSQKLEAEKIETEKLAKMSESDRWKLELEKEREQFLQEKAEFQKAQLESQALKLLASKKLPSTFVDFIVADTAEQVADNITNLENVWQEALNDAVTAKIGGRTPNTSNTQGFKGIQSLKEFGALSYKERAKLLEEDSDLLNKLK